MSAWTRASESDRTLRCLGPLLLPRVDVPSGEGADWGRGMHRLWQTGTVMPESGRENHRAQLEERVPIVDAWRRRLWPDGGRIERCIAIHCAGSSAAVAWTDDLDDAERDGWKNEFSDEWVTGSIDYVHDVAVLGDPLVSDLKTGRREDKGVRDRFQMWIYALAERLIVSASRVVGSVVLHPRYPKANPPTAIWDSWTAAELDAFWFALRDRRSELLTMRLRPGPITVADVAPGDHCTFCPSDRACPRDRGGSN